MELLPDYLRFIKGVVDTEDLPLNVSREVTQSSPVTAKIRNVITSKVLSLLEEMAKDDQEKYLKFHKNFGSVLKVGLNSDFTNKDKLTDLLRFESSKTGAEEFISLKEYVERMKPDQKEIYYVGGNFRDAVEKNPNLEFFRKNDIEVLYLTDPVDLFTIPYIYQYDGKTLKSIDKSDIEIKPDEQTSEKRLSKDLTEELTKTFKSVLGDLVEDVVESSRLVDSPSTLVVGKSGLDPQMEKMMQMMDKAYTASKRILELNPAHQLIINLSRINLEDSSSPLLRSCILQIYEGAMLNEGYLKSPADFVSRMNEIMEKATK